MNRITPSEVEEATQGRYEVLSLIGEGGMGAVFLGRHRELGSRVAIKILPPDVRFSPDRLARFRREASLSAQMSHPNLVPTIECSVEGELAYLVMPYVDGVPLDTHLEQQGHMSYDEVKELIRQVGGALTFAHNRGIIHRDIKPANILFEKDTGRWLVTDFGVAHVATETSALTHSGASIGTPAYMAPEQLGGAAEVDARADLYSLAAVAVEALTGGRPQAMAGVNEIAEAISHTRPGLPPGAAQALAAPFAVARDERPPSVKDWIATLEGQKRRTPAWMIAGGAVAALLVTWVGWAAFSGGDTAVGDGTPTVAVLPFSVTGANPGVDLDSLLPHAFTWQLQTLPGHTVLHPADVRSQLTRRFGAGPFTVDSLLKMALEVRADQALIGEVTTQDDVVTLRVQVFDIARQRIIAGADTLGPADSLHALVSGLVIEAFATRLAQEQTGAPSPSLPKGVPAIGAFFDGDRSLRRADYRRAITQFDRVIELDSSYAPAYWKRMLATVLDGQPSKAGPAVRSALDQALRVRSGLDAVTARILTAYETLLVSGDIYDTEHQLLEVVDAHPDAIDAWFLLGFLRGWFGPLLGSNLGEARGAFQQAVSRDPTFAAASAYLAQIALFEDDTDNLRHYMDQYLAVDSVSEWAELVRMGDTLIFHRDQAARVLGSFPERSDRILEYLSLGAAAMTQPGGTRPFAIDAIEELARRAATTDELVTTFRMRLAVHLGARQMRRARAVVAEGRLRGVPPSEIDRWIVLPVATELGSELRLGDAAEAARRLTSAEDEPFVSAWLAARWARRTGVDPEQFDARIRELQANGPRSPMEQSLLDDLSALDALAAGDTAEAMEIWQTGLRRLSVTEVMFGLVASLWPIRLDRARMALASGRWEEAATVGETFRLVAGFVDQVAWVPALSVVAEAALAEADTTRARDAYAELYRVLNLADDEGLAIRDSIGDLVRSWER